MTERTKSLVLDAWAVLAYYSPESSGAAVADAIADAHEAGRPVLISVANAGEVWYILARRHTDAEADRRVQELIGMGIQLVAIDWLLARTAAIFKKKGRLSYADCFAAAVAKRTHGTLLTGDQEFKPWEKEIAIHWLNQVQR